MSYRINPDFFSYNSLRIGKGGTLLFGRQKKAVVSALNLPEDVFFGEMLLSLTGSHSAVVENYRSIVLFTDTVLKLQGKTTKLTVTGKNFSIEYYDKEQLKLTGQIKSAEFETL